MQDKIIDFIEAHRVLCIILIIIGIFMIVICSMRAYNMNKKKNMPEPTPIMEETPTPTEEYKGGKEYRSDEDGNGGAKADSDYNSSLSLEAQEQKRKEEQELARAEEYEKRKAKEEEEKRVKEAKKHMKPTYGDAVVCWDKDGVPDKMVDGSSCKAYLHQVSLSDFGSKWGKKLTMDDKFATEFYMVGVNQNPDDYVKARDCQSVGWLNTNFNKMGSHAVIKFTDLNVIGSLSDTHVAVLCSYDWYSVFGNDDTLVLFEDISGTLKKKDFKQGVIFSAFAYRHNMKIKHVNGQNVVCVQYNKFKI